MNLRHELRLFFVALQFFTRVGVPAWVGFQPAWLNASARYFPLVGLCIGVFVASVLALAAQLFVLPVAVWLALGAGVLLTGAFHEDGLADTCDALGGAVSRARAFEIMKDSRVGTYGAVALVLSLGLKAAVLSALPLAGACVAWVLAHAASRAVPVFLIRVLPYAGEVDAAKAKPLAQGVSRVTFMVALVSVLVLALVLIACQPTWWLGVLLGLTCAALTAAWCRRWFAKRLGGITGDTLGASQQLAELAVLLGWLAVW